MTDEDLIKRLREVNAYEQPTEAEVDLVEAATRIEQLLRENARLQEDNSAMGWELNPDRMGGQFTEEEKNRSGWL